jgi:transcriptional regulator
MFVPPNFKPQDNADVENFLRKNTFAALVSMVNGKLWATHIPMMMGKNETGEQVFWAHISKGNPQWKEIAEQEEVMAIFQGPHTFITSDWYDHQNVSTWNYMAVHVYGKVRVLEGDALRHVVNVLVNHYETPESKGHTNNMDEKYLNQQYRGIMGIELKVERMEASFKMSQNRDEKNYQHIIEKLEERNENDDAKVAAEMRKIRNL